MKNNSIYNNSNQNYSKKLISGKVTATAGIRNPNNLTMVYGAGANRIEILKALEKQSKFRIIWYITFFILGIACLIIEPKSWFYVIDLYVLMVNIDLASQGKLIGVYIGIVECFLYAYICFISGLYGEVIKMFIINVPLNIFTVINWTKNLKEQKHNQNTNKDDSSAVVVRKLNKAGFVWLPLILVAIYTGSFFGLKALNTSALIFSAGALTCTIFSKILNGLRFKENWWFTIALNLINTGMWIQVMVSAKNGGISLIELPALVSTFACLTNSFYGYNIWKSMYRKIAVNGGEILAIRKVKINKIIKIRRKYQKLVWDKKIDINKNS